MSRQIVRGRSHKNYIEDRVTHPGIVPPRRRELSPDKRVELRTAILALLGQGEDGARPLAEIVRELQKDSSATSLPRIRIIDEVGRLRTEGLVRARRKVGYWRASAETSTPTEPAEERAAEEVPTQPTTKESDYYAALLTWLQGRYHCYAEDVSEKGKRGRRAGKERLLAVPDIAGVRYIPGTSKDQLELIAVEVKVGKPTSAHLSEAFRYSRFADFCYVAYDEESLSDDGILAELMEKAVRLGIGIIRFPRRRGPGKRIVELQAPLKQQAEVIAKDAYLANKLDIWQCARCGTYHFVESDEELIQTPRSEEWTGIISVEELVASRFVCDSCKGKI